MKIEKIYIIPDMFPDGQEPDVPIYEDEGGTYFLLMKMAEGEEQIIKEMNVRKKIK